MKEKTEEKILLELESGYDFIADKFSGTRAFMWRDLEFLKDMVRPGERILDYGCGNGRLAGFLEGGYGEYKGVDISRNLIDIANQRYHSEKTEFIKVDSRFKRLPFEDSYFDAVFSIAVFHHLPSKKYREKLIVELNRILKLNGKIVITVWNLWQKRFWRYHLKAARDKLLGKSELDWKDIYISFKSEDKVFLRYHHAFMKHDLEQLLRKNGFEIESITVNHNIVCVAIKK
jgi:ubiquinone/menaquinone biosynthesis C-methylase UbiE